MQGESPTQTNTSAGAVFVSYASQDAEAASRICDALRAGGIEVWFDQSELRGGDVWDQKIRREIHDCALFIPVISANTAARHEGYFRLEWDLADQRSHMMARSRVFLVPVCLDTTTEAAADIPESFKRVQWTRLPGGAAPPAFIERIRRLLSPEAFHALPAARSPAAAASRAAGTSRQSASSPITPSLMRPVLVISAAIAVIGLGYFAVDELVLSKREAGTKQASAPAAEAVTSAQIPEKSIAVLPFIDMSEKHDEEYFADGMAEEVLNLLAQVPDLRVPGRTSSFYFKGKQAALGEIARTLGVAHVLEGSVRRAGTTIRVTVQLIRADNGYHLWSKSYDRDLKDVLKVQDDIAESVVGALKASLLGASPPRAALTVNAEAYRLYLEAHALRVYSGSTQLGIDYLRKSIELDPTFAAARAELAALIVGDFTTTGILLYPSALAEARAAADEALRLDAQLPLAHMALARLFFQLDWNWDAGEAEIRKAIALEPSNAEAHRIVGYFLTTRGRFDEAIEILQRAASLDPLQPWNYVAMGFPAYRKHNYAQAVTLYRRALALSPQDYKVHYLLGQSLLLGGQPTEALAEMEREPDPGFRHCGLALAFDALGRKREADGELATAEAKYGSEKAYWIALIHASRKNVGNAFVWLDRAAEQKDPGMQWIRGDPMLDTIAKDPRYDTLLRRIKLL